MAAVDEAVDAGARPEELGRAVAYAAALRITRFHTQNDHADWDEVHHAFTAANALHQALRRSPTPALLRGVYHGALRVYLDRFLNVPAARLPGRGAGSVRATVGRPGRARRRAGTRRAASTTPARSSTATWPTAATRRGPSPPSATRCSTEDAEFHWFQTYEAAVRQFHAWPAGSEEGALILAGAARFLAAHTPTRRELSQVVRIATRLQRGEALFEEA